MDKMEERTRQRILDLANLADRRGIITYTDFMNLNELNIFHSTVGKIPFVRWKLFGGYAKAERQLAAFIPDALYFRYDFSQKGDSDEDAIPFPIVCLRMAARIAPPIRAQSHPAQYSVINCHIGLTPPHHLPTPAGCAVRCDTPHPERHLLGYWMPAGPCPGYSCCRICIYLSKV